jgi:hypothetical protein
MPRVVWPLLRHQPRIEISLTTAADGRAVARRLLADTGAGTARAGFELLLDERDCLLCGGVPLQPVALGGAYSGTFPVYLIRVEIPGLGLDEFLPAVGITRLPRGFGGLACFRFLNRFTYGNFGDPGAFGLET